MSKKQKSWIAVGVSVVVIIAIVLVVASIRSQSTSNAAAYQTTTVQVGTLTSSVDGSGTVASPQTANLSWSTSGQVDQVFVKIGQQVKSGDVLATLLQDTKTQNSLQTALVNAQENLAELTSPEAIANAKLAVANDEASVINAQIALNNLQYWKNEALIQDYYAQVVIAKENLDRAQTAYDNAQVGDYINNANEAQAYKNLYTAQQDYNHAEYLFSLYSQKPTQRAVDAAQATLDLSTATLAQDKAYLTAITGGSVPAGTTGTNLLKFQQAQLAVEDAQGNLDASSLTAPFDGTITQANVVPGAIVSANSQVFRMDNLTNLEVNVQVTEVDINGIQAGQPATLKFNAIPNKTYHGEVVQTNLAGTVGQNSTTFTVAIQITDADALVKPGMAANVTIVTNQVADALLVPTTAIFTDTNGQQYVYLVVNGITTTVPVTVGAISDTTSQITGTTLKEGDTIILSFASSSSTSSGGFGFGLGGIVGSGPRDGGQPQVTNP